MNVFMNIRVLTERYLRAIVNLGSSGGASTLTQQLAKQLFHGEGSKFYLRIVQKVKSGLLPFD
jgi:penicillin-binding protein 1A